MSKIYSLENEIQNYAWGDKNALFALFGIENPLNEPQAEIWIGAHPKASSMVFDGDLKTTMTDLIAKNPNAILGKKVAAAFNEKLPFLFKILNAGKPLSIQSHPSLEQAKRGFHRENLAQIPLNAFNRNYKDDNHKPELICALTPFKAMNGFRDIGEIITLFENLSTPILIDELSALKLAPNKSGLKRFYTWMMSLPVEQKFALTTDAINVAVNNIGDLAFDTLLNLHSYYPNDIGIMCAMMLNVLELQPGEAMYLDAGELHAYLHGVGMEIMANSDNVLRGGLTPKYVDTAELLTTLSFKSGPVDIITAQKTHNKMEHIYPTPVKEFDFSVIELTDNEAVCFCINSVEIIFCMQGVGTISANDNETTLSTGQSFLIPASMKNYKIAGQVKLFKASVPFIEE